MNSLTIQAYLQSQWQDIAELTFTERTGQNEPDVQVQYKTDYAIEHLEQDDHHAVSLNHPVQLYFDDDDQPGWLRFLDDIIPSGAARRFWVDQLEISNSPLSEQNLILLEKAAIAPVGHLRIKQAVENQKEAMNPPQFTISDVVERNASFLEYAQQRGAIAGGATGAGGEAPKLLLRCNNNDEVWIDTFQDGTNTQDAFYLVKFPRGQRKQIDCDILRAEYHFYCELEEIGVSTIATEQMRLEEGDNFPSLWLPRFDVEVVNGVVTRKAMESVYSILKRAPGVRLRHADVIRELVSKIENSYMVKEQGAYFNVEAFVTEWVRRDLLNIAFGNSDNHGRNTAFFRDESGIKLTPIYDFAPMRADPEGVPRSTVWGEPMESGGEYNFSAICEELSDLIKPEQLLDGLHKTAEQLIGLEGRLRKRGVPGSIMTMPKVGLANIPEKLKRWGLL